MSSSRSSLLRETNRLASEILRLHAAVLIASDDLARESAVKASHMSALASADAELLATKRTHAAEASNDGELAALQRGVAALTAKLAELVATTKRARPLRDKAKEEALVSYYMRTGVEAELLLAMGDGTAAASTVFWPPSLLALLSEADALWRRVSSADTVVCDMVEAALGTRGLSLLASDVSGGGGGGGGVNAPPAASAYLALGARAAADDARRALIDSAEMEKVLMTLRAKLRGVVAAEGGGGGGEGSSKGAVDALTTVLESIEATILGHQEMLRAAEAAGPEEEEVEVVVVVDRSDLSVH